MNLSCLRFLFVVCLFSPSISSLFAQDILIEDVIFSVEIDSAAIHTPTSSGGLAFQSYPNPTSNLLTLETTDGAAITLIQIIALSDQSSISLTPQSEANRITLSVGNLTAGTYSVSIITAAGTLTKTFQVIH